MQEDLLLDTALQAGVRLPSDVQASTMNCVDPNPQPDPEKIVEDSSGTLYIGGAKPKKSIDHGETWSSASAEEIRSALGSESTQVVAVQGREYTMSGKPPSTNGVEFSIGTVISPAWTWTVFRRESGKDWEKADDFSIADGRVADAQFLQADASGAILVFGRILSSNDSATAVLQGWIIRRSTDLGKSWSTATDDLTTLRERLGALYAHEFLVTRSGALLVSAVSTAKQTYILRSSDGGTRWAAVNETAGMLFSPQYAPSFLLETQDGMVFATQPADTSGTLFQVIKSVDRGETWTAITPFMGEGLPNGDSNMRLGFLIDSGGRLFASATRYGGDGVNIWIVKRSTDAGATWKTVYAPRFVLRKK